MKKSRDIPEARTGQENDEHDDGSGGSKENVESGNASAARLNTTVARIPADMDAAEAKILASTNVIEGIQPLPQHQEPATSQPGAFPVGHALGVPLRTSPVVESELEVEEPPLSQQDEETTNSQVLHEQTEDDTCNLPIAAELAMDPEVTREELEAQIEDQLRREFEQKMEQEYVRRSRVQSAEAIDVVQIDADLTVNTNMSNSSNQNQRPPTTARTGEHGNNQNTSDDSATKRKRRMLLLLAIILVTVAVVGVIVGVTVSQSSTTTDTNSNSSNDKPATDVTDGDPNVDDNVLPVLQSVRKRGFLRCKPESLEAEKGEGLTIDLCRAIAAAIFNDPSKVELIYFPFRAHFAAIQDGRLDVSSSHVSLNMGRDVRETNTHVGYAYSTPYIYTGTGLAGVPNFVDCAQEAETFEQDCRHLKVCVMIDTVTQDIVEAHLPGSATRLVEGHGDLFRQFANDTCNVVAGDTVIIHEQLAREAGYEGEYKFADKLLSHEHLALLSRQDDPEWAQFCDWILRALITADALNVTDQTAQGFWETDLFGPEYTQMFAQAIAAVGNYGQIYERHYRGILPRSPYNSINTGSTGLIVSDPLGTLELDEESLPEEILPRPIPDGTMEAVVNRGHLYCGVILHDDDGNARQGLAEYNSTSGEWSGLDVDYCRGIAAAVSVGKSIYTIFVNQSNPKTRYKALSNGTVDVLAGDIFTMTTDVREPTTGQGFTFATPYYYENDNYNLTTSNGGIARARAIVTRQDDPQWSDLAQWIIHATFYAEENNITRNTAPQMPVVELFGTQYRQMFRDTIRETGNYGEMYERNLGHLRRRDGHNLLNVEDTPQFFPILDPMGRL